MSISNRRTRSSFLSFCSCPKWNLWFYLIESFVSDSSTDEQIRNRFHEREKTKDLRKKTCFISVCQWIRPFVELEIDEEEKEEKLSHPFCFHAFSNWKKNKSSQYEKKKTTNSTTHRISAVLTRHLIELWKKEQQVMIPKSWQISDFSYR